MEYSKILDVTQMSRLKSQNKTTGGNTHNLDDSIFTSPHSIGYSQVLGSRMNTPPPRKNQNQLLDEIKRFNNSCKINPAAVSNAFAKKFINTIFSCPLMSEYRMLKSLIGNGKKNGKQVVSPQRKSTYQGQSFQPKNRLGAANDRSKYFNSGSFEKNDVKNSLKSVNLAGNLNSSSTQMSTGNLFLSKVMNEQSRYVKTGTKQDPKTRNFGLLSTGRNPSSKNTILRHGNKQRELMKNSLKLSSTSVGYIKPPSSTNRKKPILAKNQSSFIGKNNSIEESSAIVMESQNIFGTVKRDPSLTDRCYTPQKDNNYLKNYRNYAKKTAQTKKNNKKSSGYLAVPNKMKQSESSEFSTFRDKLQSIEAKSRATFQQSATGPAENKSCKLEIKSPIKSIITSSRTKLRSVLGKNSPKFLQNRESESVCYVNKNKMEFSVTSQDQNALHASAVLDGFKKDRGPGAPGYKSKMKLVINKLDKGFIPPPGGSVPARQGDFAKEKSQGQKSPSRRETVGSLLKGNQGGSQDSLRFDKIPYLKKMSEKSSGILRTSNRYAVRGEDASKDSQGIKNTQVPSKIKKLRLNEGASSEIYRTFGGGKNQTDGSKPSGKDPNVPGFYTNYRKGTILFPTERSSQDSILHSSKLPAGNYYDRDEQLKDMARARGKRSKTDLHFKNKLEKDNNSNLFDSKEVGRDSHSDEQDFSQVSDNFTKIAPQSLVLTQKINNIHKSSLAESGVRLEVNSPDTKKLGVMAGGGVTKDKDPNQESHSVNEGQESAIGITAEQERLIGDLNEETSVEEIGKEVLEKMAIGELSEFDLPQDHPPPFDAFRSYKKGVLNLSSQCGDSFVTDKLDSEIKEMNKCSLLYKNHTDLSSWSDSNISQELKDTEQQTSEFKPSYDKKQEEEGEERKVENQEAGEENEKSGREKQANYVEELGDFEQFEEAENCDSIDNCSYIMENTQRDDEELSIDMENMEFVSQVFNQNPSSDKE